MSFPSTQEPLLRKKKLIIFNCFLRNTRIRRTKHMRRKHSFGKTRDIYALYTKKRDYIVAGPFVNGIIFPNAKFGLFT